MKTLFILGSTGDIGKAILDKFVDSGYNVIAPTRAEINLEERGSIESYFQKIKIKQAVDVLIYCAGYNSPKPFNELSYADLDKTSAINTTGFFGIVQRIAPNMMKVRKGHILAISSIYGSFSREGRLAYALSKHALNGMVKTLAIELGKYNIMVNALSPGFVDTKMTRKNNSEEKIKELCEGVPLGRLAKSPEIANVAFFLCSAENTYLTGQDIIVDGGYSVGGFQR